MNPNKIIKSEPMVVKQEGGVKMDSVGSANNVTPQPVPPQQPLAMHPKDVQPYANLYQRHPMGLGPPQPLSREEDLRRFFYTITIINLLTKK